MRIATILIAGLGALSLAACESKQDKAAEATADSLESQAAATPNEAAETQLNKAADATEQAHDAAADKVEQDAGKKD